MDGLLDFKLTCNADGFNESVSHRESDGTTYKYAFKETDENGSIPLQIIMANGLKYAR